jgi:hypothetical protein
VCVKLIYGDSRRPNSPAKDIIHAKKGVGLSYEYVLCGEADAIAYSSIGAFRTALEEGKSP